MFCGDLTRNRSRGLRHSGPDLDPAKRRMPCLTITQTPGLN